MLFDLQGKRRRVVQATYLMLAILMGGGLVLFGIGSGASGGLFDIFSDSNGGSGNEVVEQRVEDNEAKVKQNPKAQAARKELVRDYYSLAAGQIPQGGNAFPADAKDELRNASKHWQIYIETESGKPDKSLAVLALQLYDPTALNRPKEAMKVARLVAEQDRSAAAYIQLVQYALLAEDKRTEQLASAKVIALTPKKQRKQATKQLEQLKAQVIAQQLQESGDLNIDPTQQGGSQQSQKTVEIDPSKSGGGATGGSGANGSGGDKSDTSGSGDSK